MCVFVFSMGKCGESDKAMTNYSQFCNFAKIIISDIYDHHDDFAYAIEVFTNRPGYIMPSR